MSRLLILAGALCVGITTDLPVTFHNGSVLSFQNSEFLKSFHKPATEDFSVWPGHRTLSMHFTILPLPLIYTVIRPCKLTNT